MKTKEEIKERIKDLNFSISIARECEVYPLVNEYKFEIEILQWVLDGEV